MEGDKYLERVKELIQIMDINPKWRMHQISDGERRRVQLVLGLIKPWTLLLMDEVTVDLDVLVRADLLEFLKRETEKRDATIVSHFRINFIFFIFNDRKLIYYDLNKRFMQLIFLMVRNCFEFSQVQLKV